MIDITLKTNTMNSIIHCGAGTFEKYAPALKERRPFIVTDKNVFGLYRHLLWETFGADVPITILPAGETAKTKRRLFEILQAMTDAGVKRNTVVIAFGGGVVGDITGLAASLYMRGVPLVQIPTTLLSQVDSSVGGKTAIDFNSIKNLIGTFYQPQEVIVDPRFLQTLPAREIRCGLGEIVKYGALDKGIYKKLCENSKKLFDLDFLGDITADCIRHKAEVVSRDEHDLTGIRKTLNLGHTTGHALELHYGKKSHGEFVLIGTYYEMYIAKSLGLGGGEYYGKIINLIKSVIKKIPSYEDIERAALAAAYDKKNVAGGKISLVVPKCEGESAEISITPDKYAKLLAECSEELS